MADEDAGIPPESGAPKDPGAKDPGAKDPGAKDPNEDGFSGMARSVNIIRT
jgi:hypothetical protein